MRCLCCLTIAGALAATLLPASAHANRRGVREQHWRSWSVSSVVATVSVSQTTVDPFGVFVVANVVHISR